MAAEIYTFPATMSMRTAGSTDARSGAGSHDDVPKPVEDAVQSVRDMVLRDAFEYREIPVPASLADYGIGVEISSGERASTAVSGWIMVLYSHRMRSGWRSRWRCVAFASWALRREQHNSLTPSLYWTDIERLLVDRLPGSLMGTVSVNHNTSFESSNDVEPVASVSCEARASWTPDVRDGSILDAGRQIDMWALFLTSLMENEEGSDIFRG
ncbi:DUF3000 family protein [Bifidobacterium simiarum]|uniref:DUF3000 family protein n=1 Tax=Bifidobacterium simiarum TaxID=2045441 RepID=A0A2M9HHI4_9BIFI|nr:DUF3000 family protein [Bifidobacterium simiarum]PJM76274.1 hypothetical protein CSQ87_01825 [Bifidobacterium simiarum]